MIFDCSGLISGDRFSTNSPSPGICDRVVDVAIAGFDPRFQTPLAKMNFL